MANEGTLLTYSEIDAESKNLRSEKQEIQDRLDGLSARMGDMTQRSFRTQQASDKFHEMYLQFTSDAHKTIENIESIADFLDNMVRLYQETDAQVAAGIQI